MSDENTPPQPPRTRRTAADRLRAALSDLHQHRGQVLTHTEKAWASITFAGTRHTLRMVFDTPEAVEGGEALIAALPDHEFALPGRLVADATVSAVDHAAGPPPRMVVTCELLLLEDG